MKIILRFLLVAGAIMALPHLVPGIAVAGIYPALIAAAIFGLLNLVVKPIVGIVTLPINIVTLGLFGLVVNSLLLWFVGSFVAGFSVATFTAAFVGALILAVVNWIAHLF
ncbi:MAG TPA: phage holin family protein [Candidatus Paceibacterota bacterium]|nr:phage holin family protein [Candidatus Paceibacterota bacterium]